MRIRANNLVIMGIVVLVYVLIDFIFFSKDTGSFFLVLTVQLGFIALAVSPIGEAILRFAYGFKKLTVREEEYILPIFNSVHEDVLRKYPKTNPNIKLYIWDTMEVNACALGSKTVAITRGAIETLSEEELKGFFAHEFGHLLRGDTLLPLVFIVGNGMFLIFLLVVRVLQLMITFVTAHGDILFIGRLVNLLITALLSLALFIVQALLLINDRQNEYLADKFAHELGYGKDLTNALYNMNETSFSGKESMLDKIKSSHPNIRKRIERLEGMPA